MNKSRYVFFILACLFGLYVQAQNRTPPLPNNNTFIFIFLLIVITYFLNTLQNNGLSFHADVPGHVP